MNALQYSLFPKGTKKKRWKKNVEKLSSFESSEVEEHVNRELIDDLHQATHTF